MQSRTRRSGRNLDTGADKDDTNVVTGNGNQHTASGATTNDNNDNNDNPVENIVNGSPVDRSSSETVITGNDSDGDEITPAGTPSDDANGGTSDRNDRPRRRSGKAHELWTAEESAYVMLCREKGLQYKQIVENLPGRSALAARLHCHHVKRARRRAQRQNLHSSHSHGPPNPPYPAESSGPHTTVPPTVGVTGSQENTPGASLVPTPPPVVLPAVQYQSGHQHPQHQPSQYYHSRHPSQHLPPLYDYTQYQPPQYQQAQYQQVQYQQVHYQQSQNQQQQYHHHYNNNRYTVTYRPSAYHEAPTPSTGQTYQWSPPSTAIASTATTSTPTASTATASTSTITLQKVARQPAPRTWPAGMDSTPRRAREIQVHYPPEIVRPRLPPSGERIVLPSIRELGFGIFLSSNGSDNGIDRRPGRAPDHEIRCQQ